MKNILTINEADINPESKSVSKEGFNERQAARAIVLNDKKEVALLNVSKHNYHKLPGGGVEPGEDLAIALERELLEEIGCTAKITSELGVIIEYRDQWRLKQTSYCYIAIQYGEIKNPEFTTEELQEGFEVIWVKNIDEAIKLLEIDMPDNYDGSFIKLRDLTLLKEYQKSSDLIY